MESNVDNSLFGDMANLEQSLSEDSTGDRARAMLEYFNTLLSASTQLLSNSGDEAERSLIQQLNSGFYASQRIIRHVWETIHGTMLHV